MMKSNSTYVTKKGIKMVVLWFKCKIREKKENISAFSRTFDRWTDWINPSWPSTNDILTIVSISIAVIALACCILLFFKVRKMHIALMLMQNIHMAKSQKVPSFIYKTLTTPAPSYSNAWLLQEFSLLHAYIIIGTLINTHFVCHFPYLALSQKIWKAHIFSTRINHRWSVCIGSNHAVVIVSFLLWH